MAQETAGRLDIAELKRLHAAATPGEWAVSKRAYKGDGHKYLEIESIGKAYWVAKVLWFDPSPVNGEDLQFRSNAESIAALHNAFPALLDRLEAAEAAMQWRPLEEAHEDWGVCVFINIHEPEPICASTMDDDFAETAKHYGWTHFRRITLTNEDAAALLAALPAPPEAAR